ncbi:MAG: adenylate/guanylate cyclase domain-containing protein [Deltaproteobacteria bacterium]|nr:adenylate/guanylate cyclase domain-containing protein [Deltaproteobacteria bacterium]
MTGHQKAMRSGISAPADISLRGFYIIGGTATAIGVLVVFLLNVSTPMDFIRARFGELTQQQGALLVQAIVKRLLILLGVIAGLSGLGAGAMHVMLRPIAGCLRLLKAGEEPPEEWTDRARRRLINLPFLSIAVYLGMWIVIPLLFFISSYATTFIDFKTAVVFSARAIMVGLISSHIAFYRIESYSRKKIIPFFFPHGRLAEVHGAARVSISRRIRMFFRLGSVVPGTILLVTLLTLQWELDPTIMSAREYGRGIIIFTVVLSAIFFMTSGALNRLVSRSIAKPVNDMLGQVDKIRQGDYSSRVRVVSNDEIGLLGDAGNRMIRGLAEREMIRTAFGKYVTPEIRDEILSGRIPLEGERREATVLFADLRNFTPFVENNPPEEVISGMRAYFTAMHAAIRRHKGVVLQFVGDEIEAVFGIPVPFESHADAALQAALDMRRALNALNAERSSQGKPPFSHGIGAHSGYVLAGNSGSDEQSAYALIGNTVNVASRIQGLTKDIGCDILVSQETVDRLKESYPLEAYAPRPVKGYSKPVIVHRIVG